MQAISRPRRFPNRSRLSVVAATILLAYTLARFINLPVRTIELQLPGFYFNAEVSLRTIIGLLVAGLTATGADWLLRDHPALQKRSTMEHWLLPALTAWVIGLPLLELPFDLVWWLGYLLGSTILMLVLVAEYIVVDPTDIRHPPAAAGLTAVSFALFLVMATTLRFSNLRLFEILPPLTLAIWLVSLRALNLRLLGKWALLESGVVALLVGQLAAALHYWPLSPVSYGLVLLGPAYALTSLVASLSEGASLRSAALEPGIVLLVVWGAAVWLH